MQDIVRDDIIRHARRIAEEYRGNLTVRQLYYQFVARNLLESGDSSYKRVVMAVAKARLNGLIPFSWIVDRTRECKPSDVLTNHTDVEEALSQAKGWIRSMPEWALQRARWHGQPKLVTVGVEKEALAGVFDEPCGELGVGMFVFRGYASLSALWQWAKHVEEVDPEEVILLYFGDHDPDGWEIPRSAMRNLHDICATESIYLPPIRLKRVALNMEQIRRYNPPPFEAKVTSSRYKGYYEEHNTNDAWELDALRPDILQGLIREAVMGEFDEAIHKANMEEVEEARDEMRSQMREEGWILDVFEEG